MPAQPQPKRRTRRRLEPITMEELYNSPSLNGLVSFLNVPPTKDEAGNALPSPILDQDSPTPVAADRVATETVGTQSVDDLRITYAVHKVTDLNGGSRDHDHAETPIESVGTDSVGTTNRQPSRREQGSQSEATVVTYLATTIVGSEPVGSVSIPTVPIPTIFVGTDSRGIQTSELCPVPEPTPTTQMGTIASVPLPTAHVPSVSVPSVFIPSDTSLTVRRSGAHLSQRRTVIQCTTVQHGHTGQEQTVYDFLWQAAAKYGIKESGASRRMRIKQPWIAKQLGVHENSIRTLIRNLEAKLAIEEVSKAGPALGREIRIWSYETCLARRRAAGLVYSIRSHGVQLLTREQVEQMLDTGDPAEPIPTYSIGTDPVGTESVAENESVATVDGRDIPTETAVLSLQNRQPSKEYISKANKHSDKQPPPTIPTIVLDAIREVAGEATDRMATQIIDACCKIRPDARPREIAHFIRHRGSRANGIANMPAFLISKVPEHFEGRAFERFREEETRRIRGTFDAQRNSLEQTRQMCQQILEDPNSDDSDRQWATERLAEYAHDLSALNAREEHELNG